MIIKMLALDLDGTLLRDDKTISERTNRALEKCRKKGIKIVCATARGNLKGIVPDGLFDGRILKSGAVAHIGEKLIYSKTMSIEYVRPFLLAVNNMGLPAAVEHSNGIHYANFKVNEKWEYIVNYETVDFAAINFDPDKIYVITETPDSVAFVKKHAPADAHLFISRDHISFLFHKDAIKSKATQALAESWGINQSEIVAFGDDLVDIDLLKYCGTGVAVGNALDEVKSAADYICDTNNNDGVAKWIEGNILA
jgi:Cof subfamily protein (haloacid dehalogenase superfamily)